MTSTCPEILRTPDARFAAITDYPWAPHYLEVEPGLRMAYIDAGPADATETVLLLHGQPMWGYLYRKMIGPLAAAGSRTAHRPLAGEAAIASPGRRRRPAAAVALRSLRQCGFSNIQLKFDHRWHTVKQLLLQYSQELFAQCKTSRLLAES